MYIKENANACLIYVEVEKELIMTYVLMASNRAISSVSSFSADNLLSIA